MRSFFKAVAGVESVENDMTSVIEKKFNYSAPVPQPPGSPRARVDRNLMDEVAIAEYRKVANEIGLPADDVAVEEFRHFLAKKDWPTFNLQEVTTYLDELVKKDNSTGLGWHWVAVRPKDSEVAMHFGRPSSSDWNTHKKTPASDYYQSHNFKLSQQYANPASSNAPARAPHWSEFASPVYSRTIPLHALKKIAAVEKDYKGKVVFLVSDYVVSPHVVINPDPFLMAVIPNSGVGSGKGRFIIDVWDEPGFGIDRMVK